MPKGPIRRAQIITPFGVGALTVLRDQRSVIQAGLDHWYQREDGDPTFLDDQEYRIQEWRLEYMLGVDHFRLPPDYRKPGAIRIPNCSLTIPALSFPCQYFCQSCGQMASFPLTLKAKQECATCKTENQRKGKKRKKFLVQVPFIAFCDQGHIQDFPWREWLHRSIHPQCQEPLTLISKGATSLADWRIECKCGASRTLAKTTEFTNSSRETSYLSSTLSSEGPFLCQGKRPWLGSDEATACNRPLVASPRNATNLYFPTVKTSIFLPQGTSFGLEKLIEQLNKPGISALIEKFAKKNLEIEPDFLRSQYQELMEYTDRQIATALDLRKKVTLPLQTSPLNIDSLENTVSFRRAEWNELLKPQKTVALVVEKISLDRYSSMIQQHFSAIHLVRKLRETRVLAGFTRMYPENGQTPQEQMMGLRKTPTTGENNWLPASIVYGEGIFLVFNETKLRQWESGDEVQKRILALVNRFKDVQQKRRLPDKEITPRSVLIHTFAHLLVNRLTYECGYATASLRERLYVSVNEEQPMAGVLIYTASGDSEGTLGGLVRTGNPQYLEPILERALENAQWCSADPVCSEIGDRGGQGPDSCNLAACHNCSLVPETTCEEFNRFLDRTLVVGGMLHPGLGYFDLKEA